MLTPALVLFPNTCVECVSLCAQENTHPLTLCLPACLPSVPLCSCLRHVNPSLFMTVLFLVSLLCKCTCVLISHLHQLVCLCRSDRHGRHCCRPEKPHISKKGYLGVGLITKGNIRDGFLFIYIQYCLPFE